MSEDSRRTVMWMEPMTCPECRGEVTGFTLGGAGEPDVMKPCGHATRLPSAQDFGPYQDGESRFSVAYDPARNRKDAPNG